jgi:hypothetical protein
MSCLDKGIYFLLPMIIMLMCVGLLLKYLLLLLLLLLLIICTPTSAAQRVAVHAALWLPTQQRGRFSCASCDSASRAWNGSRQGWPGDPSA